MTDAIKNLQHQIIWRRTKYAENHTHWVEAKNRLGPDDPLTRSYYKWMNEARDEHDQLLRDLVDLAIGAVTA